MINIAEWETDFNKKYPQLFDGAGEYEGYTCDMTDDVKDFIRTLLAQQREEILDQVGKEMNKWWKDEGYWTCGANEAVEGVLEILSDKLSALRLSIKKNK